MKRVLTGLFVALMAPLLVLSLPFILIGLILEERLRRCPNCGCRGTLRDVTPPRKFMDGDALRAARRRVVITRWWRCEACGVTFEQSPD